MEWGTLTAALSGLVALGGVWLGSTLSRRNADDQWKRDQRLKTYSEILAALRSVNTQFATSVRVNAFRGESALEAGHDVEGTEWRWIDTFEEVAQLEDQLLLVGGDGVSIYEAKVNPLLADYWDAIRGKPSTEEWDALARRGEDALDATAKAFRRDLAGKRPTWRLARRIA